MKDEEVDQDSQVLPGLNDNFQLRGHCRPLWRSSGRSDGGGGRLRDPDIKGMIDYTITTTIVSALRGPRFGCVLDFRVFVQQDIRSIK